MYVFMTACITLFSLTSIR